MGQTPAESEGASFPPQPPLTAENGHNSLQEWGSPAPLLHLGAGNGHGSRRKWGSPAPLLHLGAGNGHGSRRKWGPPRIPQLTPLAETGPNSLQALGGLGSSVHGRGTPATSPPTTATTRG
ncbi:hypothetical protein KIL84_004257 [Mauremys mutica]|uniref:Uncharacterized protein n=1 Tax=Mauremys mutica TaxID=74926 RepID=A0A9D3XPC9_9SAUR|nr:hypothetical protein KIL84_004257 [Mauremys mutica]